MLLLRYCFSLQGASSSRALVLKTRGWEGEEPPEYPTMGAGVATPQQPPLARSGGLALEAWVGGGV